MTDEKKTDIIRAGLSTRRLVRVHLLALAADGLLAFSEEKGSLSSHFIVVTSLTNRERIKETIARFDAA
jgi:hypothetical protein